MDEAGDPGFSPASSRSYVIGYVIMAYSTPHFIRNRSCRLLRKVNSQLKASSKISEFKFSVDSDSTRLKFFRLINSFDIDAGAVAVMKDSVKRDLRGNPNVLYNYLTANYVVPVVIAKYLKSTMPMNRIKFKIDKSLSKSDRAKFDEYFEGKVAWIRKKEGFRSDILAEIEHENSHNDVCIQIADYISGAVYRLTERNDSRYYDMIKNKVKYRQKWDWNEKIVW